MKLPRILIDSKIPFIRGALDDVAEVGYLDGSAFTPSVVRNADELIIRTRTICNAQLLEGSGVKFIASATIGFDHIDTKYCDEKGIIWTNAPGCNSSSVEQYMVSAILELSRRKNFNPRELTIGIIGAGNVGSKVSRAAEALGMRVRLNDTPRERADGSANFTSLEKIQKEADIISFHVPLNMEGTDRTFRMAGRTFFNGLNKPVHLINTSRGQVIDESELMEALEGGIVKSCILDVWDNEPEISPGMFKCSEMGTPHIAGYSTDGKANGTAMSVQAVSRFFNSGRNDWRPANIPVPENTALSVDCHGITELEVIREIYTETYSIAEDDTLLRKDLSGFEKLRGSYRLRREPTAYSVRLTNNKSDALISRLKKLGFTVLQSS